MIVKAYELESTYKFVCTEGEQEFIYEFSKYPPEDVELKNYLQDCKSNAIGLAEWELSQQTQVSTEQEPPKEIEI